MSYCLLGVSGRSLEPVTEELAQHPIPSERPSKRERPSKKERRTKSPSKKERRSKSPFSKFFKGDRGSRDEPEEDEISTPDIANEEMQQESDDGLFDKLTVIGILNISGDKHVL